MTEAEFDQCISRICHGDKSGLKDIYEEYMPYLYRTVYSVVQNREDAEDLTGDFFVKLWTLAPKYQPGNGHKGYLATIARNMAIDFIRKHQRETAMEEPQQDILPEEPDRGSPEEQVVERLSIREAMDRLKPQERQIVDMKVLGEMTFREISELLHIPIGTVTWRYQEGIKRLRRYGYE